MTKPRSVLACALLCFVAGPIRESRLAAQQTPTAKQIVWVKQHGEDQIGSTLAYQVREALGRSSIFALAPSESTCPQLTVDLLSTRIGAESFGASAVAVLYLITPCPDDPEVKVLSGSPIFLNDVVLVVGSDKIQESATNVVAELDRLYRSMRSK